jgi:hypothetical protein
VFRRRYGVCRQGLLITEETQVPGGEMITKPMGMTTYGWYTEVGMGGRAAVARVVAVESRDIPDGLFDLPKGYKLEGAIAKAK